MSRRLRSALAAQAVLPAVLLAVALVAALALPSSAGDDLGQPTDEQLRTVRSRIRHLEGRLVEIDEKAAGAKAERARLDANLELAEARVEELELVLSESRDEAAALRDEAAALSDEIEERQEVLSHHLEMMALLGRPGPLQLLFDAAQGGDLERSISTVAVLTRAQVTLMEELRELKRQRTRHLADLSRVLEVAGREADELIKRRRELQAVQARVEKRLRQLDSSRRSATEQLQDLRDREQALERLLSVLSSRDRMPDAEDIRSFRGALPWPASGTTVLGFGKHYLPKYATYTVCNGIRLSVEDRAPVQAIFPGEVAFARHFKGYGNMVVLDHGNDVYSLVAGLATIHVRLNQRVTMGLQLGLAAAPSEEGNLYFEIRIGKRPEDPRRWLQLEEGRS